MSKRPLFAGTRKAISITKSYNVTLKRAKRIVGFFRIGNNFNNKIVMSCREAARHRDRLGSGDGGIPLWAELKSIIYCVNDNSNGIRYFVLANTRGNTRINKNLIRDLLAIKSDHQELNVYYDDDYANLLSPRAQRDSEIKGLINPLNIDFLLNELGENVTASNIIQIFDTSLFLPGGYPDTVTTNAGIRTKFIETKSTDLFDCVRLFFNAEIASCTSIDKIWLGIGGKYPRDEWANFPPANGPKIGILTGNSPESGLTLWRDFLEQYRSIFANLSDVLMPEVLINSVPQMGLSMELEMREVDVWECVKDAVQGLLNSGCKVITIACNTTIYFTPRITKMCEPYGARFVSIAEACLPAILNSFPKNTNHNRLIGLVGIGTVIDISGKYSGYKTQLDRMRIQVKPCDATELAWEIKKIGDANKDNNMQKLINKFRLLMQSDLNNVNVVVIALTEVSLIYRKHIAKSGNDFIKQKTFIDPIYELSRYLVYLYLLAGYRTSAVSQTTIDFDLETKLKDAVFPLLDHRHDF